MVAPQGILILGSGRILMGIILCGPLIEIARRGSGYLDSAKSMVLCLIIERINDFVFNFFYRMIRI